MTQDEIIEMARQAGGVADDKTIVMWHSELEAFAKLVEERTAAKERADEREACAKEADKRLHDFTMLTSNPPQSGAAFSIAQAIRARAQADRGEA